MHKLYIRKRDMLYRWYNINGMNVKTKKICFVRNITCRCIAYNNYNIKFEKKNTCMQKIYIIT